MRALRKMLAILAAGLACTGCMSVSWNPPPRPVGTAPDSLTVLRVFEEMLPRRLQMVNTVLFQYRWHRMTGLGFLDVSTERRDFGLSAMTPAGVTLFELTCTNGESRCRFAVQPFLDNRAITAAISLDVQRMYFNLMPPADAESRIEANTLIARSAPGATATEWVFGADNVLLEKRFYEADRLVEQVGYYEYSLERGRRVPHRVMLHNVRYSYGLTVTLKELRMCE